MFVEKITVQFHQQLKLQISNLNWHTFAKFVCSLQDMVRQNKHLILCAKKALQIS